MRWKLICVDIDGTLLDDRKRLPQDAADLSLIHISEPTRH